jgi:E3 Ubiquitin ligase
MSDKDRLKFLFLLLAVAAAAAYSFWYAFKAWRENRLIADTPTSRVRSAAQGYVQFSGHGLLMSKEENRAPLSGIPCAWWRYKIEERRQSGRSRGWTTIQSDTSALPFILDDSTGQCVVDPRGAEVFPSATDVWYGDTEWPEMHIPGGPGVMGKIGDWLSSWGRYRYTEYRIQPHEPLYALGAYRSGAALNEENPEGAVAELLRTWKQDQKSLLERFDSNHDGVLDSAEWERARAEAHRQVVETMLVKPHAADASIMSKPKDGRAFLLSASDGESLGRRLRVRATAGLVTCLGSSALLGWLATHF